MRTAQVVMVASENKRSQEIIHGATGSLRRQRSNCLLNEKVKAIDGTPKQWSVCIRYRQTGETR
jgi:hypothetical protein